MSTPRKQGGSWVPLDPCCLECAIIAAWRNEHPEIEVLRPGEVRVEGWRWISAHSHLPVVSSA